MYAGRYTLFRCQGAVLELFGNAEGSSEDASNFVAFDAGRFGDLGLDVGDRHARVLVGRRGAGKSRYLRALELDAGRIDGDGLLVFPQKDESIWIPQMRWLHSAYPERFERIDIWRQLWGCAVYASLASYLVYMHAPSRRSIHASDEDREFLRLFCDRHLGGTRVPMPIVAVMNQFLHRFQDRSRLGSFIANAMWHEVEDRVLRSVASSTPIGCYVDTLDETYAASPAAATDCQVGLLQWLARKYIDTTVSNRIHVVVTVRDTVFAAFSSGEHGRRYNRAAFIRCLDWSDEAAEYFLRRKIGMLPRSARAKPNEKDDPFLNWLGVSKVSNERRGGEEERVGDFIVRHTRFLPRDCVEIANALGQYVARRVAAGQAVDPETIPQIVMDEAKAVCAKTLETVADHMVSLDPDHDRAVINNGFRQQVKGAIQSTFVPALGSERFSRRTLEGADAAYTDAIGGWTVSADGKEVMLSDILWLHGLLGYEDTNGPRPVVKYFSSTRDLRSHGGFEKPRAEHYYLHSALLGDAGLTVNRDPPIVEALSPE